jgi:hypothetical protein
MAVLQEAGPICWSCHRSLRGQWGFRLGEQLRCLRCTLRYVPLLRRSLLTALLVGTVLTAINQGGGILAGGASAALLWQIPLTYCVPFCVATWGALVNSKVSPGSSDEDA